MSSFEDTKQALQDVLNNLSPSSIINEGCVTIFHDFFAKCTLDQIIQFLPPSFQCKRPGFQFEQLRVYPQPSSQPRPISSTSNALHNVSDFTGTTVADNPSPPSCETRIPSVQNQPRDNEQPMVLTMLTTESFKKQDQQPIRPSKNALKLIQSIEEVARKGLREPEFYEDLWVNREHLQYQDRIENPLHRYGALQQIIDIGAKSEAKNIYRQRIAHILGAHELEVIQRSISDSELSTGLNRKSLAVGKLSKALGTKRNVIHQHNTKRRHYKAFYYEVGPGAILLLGESSNKELLEKELSDEDITYVLGYVQTTLPGWLSLCEKINFEVAISILRGLQISGWDGKSHYETDFMNHLGKFIDLDVFQKHAEFRPVPGEFSRKRQFIGSSSETNDVPGDQSNRTRKRRRPSHEADSTCSAFSPPAPMTSIEDNTSTSEASPSEYGESSSSVDISPTGTPRHPTSNTDFWSVVDGRDIDGANSHTKNGQSIDFVLNGNKQSDGPVPPDALENVTCMQYLHPELDATAGHQQNQASTVDLPVSVQNSDLNQIQTAEYSDSLKNPYSAPSLHNQSLGLELASDRDQTSELAWMADGDNGEKAGLYPSKRRRTSSSNPRRQGLLQPPASPRTYSQSVNDLLAVSSDPQDNTLDSNKASPSPNNAEGVFEKLHNPPAEARNRTRVISQEARNQQDESHIEDSWYNPAMPSMQPCPPGHQNSNPFQLDDSNLDKTPLHYQHEPTASSQYPIYDPLDPAFDFLDPAPYPVYDPLDPAFDFLDPAPYPVYDPLDPAFDALDPGPQFSAPFEGSASNHVEAAFLCPVPS